MLEDILPHFMASFESLVRCNFTAEVHRALALSITYAFHATPGSLPRTPKPFSATSRSSTPGIPRRPTGEINGPGPSNLGKILTKKQLAAKLLEMYTRLLCEKGSLTDIRKFARTVTNKVGPAATLFICMLNLRSGSSTSWRKTTQPWSFMDARSWLGCW